MSRLLALDQSSHITGYAVFNEGKLITYGKFNITDTDLGERLYKIRKKVKSLIVEYEIDEVVFEDIQLQDVNGSRDIGVKTFKILAEVFGVVHELLTERDIPYTAVPPVVWKASFKIAGKGRAQEKKAA